MIEMDMVDKAKKGNKAAFMNLIDNIRSQIYKTAYMQLGNRHDALDAVQETLLKAYANIGFLKVNAYFNTWLMRILLNACHDIHKQKRKVIPLHMVERSEDELTSEHMDLMEFVKNMDEIYRSVLDLRYNHDMKLEDISKTLEIPLGTVKSRLNKAHKLLKERYVREEELL